MACLTLTVFLCVLLHLTWQTQAFSWTSTVQDGSQLEGCEGESVTFPWSSRLAEEERLEKIRHYRLLTREPVNNIDLQLYGDGEEIATTDPRQRSSIQYFTLHINRATVNDSGIYTLELRVADSGENKTFAYRSKIILAVRARPRTDGIVLLLETEPEAVKVTNGSSFDFHVGLSCGPFLDRGSPPVTVTWKTPSGKALSSTSFHNGHFLLVLHNPAEVGEYTCQVNPASPALQCADTNNVVRTMATGRLRRMERRVILHDAEKDELQSKVSQQQATVSKQQFVIDLLLSATREQQSTINQQQTVIEQLRSTTSKQQSAIRQLQNSTDQQKSRITQLQNELDKVASSLTYSNCRDLQKYRPQNAVRTLNIYGQIVDAYCDQTTDGGGWTVIRRRENGKTNFYRGWNEYVSGFGNPKSEYWLGLENIHLLTKHRKYELRADLWDFGGKTAFARYGQFWLEGESDKYRLRVVGYDNRSTAGYGLNWHNQMGFSTYDRDNDKSGGNCSRDNHGAWWYSACHVSNLNGRYRYSPARNEDGIVWWDWKTGYIPLKKVEMKIRPV